MSRAVEPQLPQLLLSVSDVKQYLYCPRIPYFQHVMPVPRPVTYKMKHGTLQHIELDRLEKRRGLRSYGLRTGERLFHLAVSSPALELHGILDLVIRYEVEGETRYLPDEFKYQEGRVYTNVKYQLTAYAMMLEEQYQTSISEGFVYFIPTKSFRRVTITEEMRTHVRHTLSAIRRMFQTESFPAPLSRSRCTDCEYRRQMESSGERVSSGEAPRAGEPGCVRIMTIHAAKGLEFPVVCLPDLTHPHLLRMEGLHLCEEYGLTAREYDSLAASGRWRSTLSYAAAARLEKEALIAEKKRLFYVGLTRAQERVILSGAATKFAEKSTLEECSNWWDWLPHLLPELRGRELGEAVCEGRGWKMKIVPDAHVPRVQAGERWTSERTRVSDERDKRMEEEESARIEYVDTQKIWSVTSLVKTMTGADGNAGPVGRRGVPLGRTADLQPYEWGQVVHALLEHMRPDDTEETIREVRLPAAFASRGFTGRQRIDQVWERVRESVGKYRASELFREYRMAVERYQEMPFLLEWMPGVPVSGVIDALWLRPDGKATVVDFKTRPCRTEQEVKAVAEQYSMQVIMYAAVVERLLGWEVDRTGVYLTEAGRFVEVEMESGKEMLTKELSRAGYMEG